MTKRLTYPLALAAVLALVLLLAAYGGGGDEDDTAPTTYRGITYDTGSAIGAKSDPLSRRLWSKELMEGEIAVIDEQLHANSVSVIGTDVDRLVETATAALERDLHVWIQPRPYEGTRAEILAHLARTARAAERLREEHSHVSLNVGVESTLFVPGIIPGRWALERIEFFRSGRVDFKALQRRLNAYLARAVAVARANFDGKITYSSGPWEAKGIDWSQFDYVGLDYYTFHERRAEYVRELEQFRRFGKPILITEFGANAFRGSPQLEGDGWALLDWTKNPAEIRGNRVRDEQVQADYLVKMLEIFDSVELDGAFVFTFISPDEPHVPNPRYDQDLVAYSVVKVIPDNPGNLASTYRWEPKQAFHALADYYGSAEE